MDWRTPRDLSPPLSESSPIHLDGATSHLKSELRWLGYWFTPCLTTTLHFTKRLPKAQATFVVVKSLFPPGMGLRLFICHMLASSPLFPMLTYAGVVLTPTAHVLQIMFSFWDKVQRWTTKCFLCTPTDIVGYRGRPTASRPPTSIEKEVGHSESSVLPPGNQPKCHSPPLLGPNALTTSHLPSPAPPPGKECRKTSPT